MKGRAVSVFGLLASVTLALVLLCTLTAAAQVPGPGRGEQALQLAPHFQPGEVSVARDVPTYAADPETRSLQAFAPGVPGWVQVNVNGFGDPGNLADGLAEFDGWLYAGGRGPAGGKIWRFDGQEWTDVITDGLPAPYATYIGHLVVFKNQLYAGGRAWDEPSGTPLGGEIWRSGEGLNWTRVVSQSFGDAADSEVWRMAVFGDSLYASTFSWTTPPGLEIWHSTTGDTGDWTQVVSDGFDGDSENRGIYGFEPYNGYLYAGTYNKTTGGEVWRSPNGTDWAQVNTDGFGDAGNYRIGAFAAFDGNLYASTSHEIGSGTQVWRCQTCDGTDWTRVVDNGFGNPDTRMLSALVVFDGQLYLAGGNAISGLEVWRTANGTAWEQIGFGGFGDSNSYATLDALTAVYQNRLYIAVFNFVSGMEVWKKTVTADFTASPASGPPPLVVRFANNSGGDYVTSLWDFGDGTTSTGTDPSHTYDPGTFTVTLTVGDGVETSTFTRTNYISAMYRAYLPVVLRD